MKYPGSTVVALNTAAATGITTTSAGASHEIANGSTTAGDLVSLSFRSHEGSTLARAKISAGYDVSGSRGFLSLTTKNSAGNMTEALRIDGVQSCYHLGSVGIGVPTTTALLGPLHMQYDSGQTIYFSEASSDTNHITFQCRKFRGTHASPSDVASGDWLFDLGCMARSGSTNFSTSGIRSIVDGSFVSGQRPPSRIEFYTNKANTSSAIALRLDNAQNCNVAPSVALTAGGNTTGGLVFGSSPSLGIYFGSGAPTITAGKGSLYLRSDGSSTSTRAYINTDGSTTWTAITTAA